MDFFNKKTYCLLALCCLRRKEAGTITGKGARISWFYDQDPGASKPRGFSLNETH